MLTHDLKIVRNLVDSKTRLYAAAEANADSLGLERVAADAVAAGVDALGTTRQTQLAFASTGPKARFLLYPWALIEPGDAAFRSRSRCDADDHRYRGCRVASQRTTRPIRVFLKIDVEMKRLGCAPREIASLAELRRRAIVVSVTMPRAVRH